MWTGNVFKFRGDKFTNLGRRVLVRGCGGGICAENVLLVHWAILRICWVSKIFVSPPYAQHPGSAHADKRHMYFRFTPTSTPWMSEESVSMVRSWQYNIFLLREAMPVHLFYWATPSCQCEIASPRRVYPDKHTWIPTWMKFWKSGFHLNNRLFSWYQ